MKFKDLFQILSDLSSFIGDDQDAQASRQRLIERTKWIVDAATQWLAQHDESSIGILLDQLAQRCRQTSFFGKP